jgi:hypothetical protein
MLVVTLLTIGLAACSASAASVAPLAQEELASPDDSALLPNDADGTIEDSVAEAMTKSGSVTTDAVVVEIAAVESALTSTASGSHGLGEEGCDI